MSVGHHRPVIANMRIGTSLFLIASAACLAGCGEDAVGVATADDPSRPALVSLKTTGSNQRPGPIEDETPPRPSATPADAEPFGATAGESTGQELKPSSSFNPYAQEPAVSTRGLVVDGRDPGATGVLRHELSLDVELEGMRADASFELDLLLPKGAFGQARVIHSTTGIDRATAEKVTIRRGPMFGAIAQWASPRSPLCAVSENGQFVARVDLPILDAAALGPDLSSLSLRLRFPVDVGPDPRACVSQARFRDVRSWAGLPRPIERNP